MDYWNVDHTVVRQRQQDLQRETENPRLVRALRHELAESALLAEDQSVEVFEVEGGDLRPDALLNALDRISRAGS